ncbi:MAG: PilZ domain-containing protein [Burkholderiales bacterium]|uniref:PilZ domain-containing protein n=1 Tax=Inhella sp. TaxID=1921806 RepID=UPI001AC2D4BE|nr:PilZ domain-containing protein [Burkholderiales bacterium]
MPDHAQDRRHFVRVVFDAEAQLITTEARYRAQVLDLSLRGALLELEAEPQFETGEPCLFALRLGEATVKMAGDVAHVKDRQIGLHCRSIDLESISHLRRLVEMNLGGGPLLERELKALLVT